MKTKAQIQLAHDVIVGLIIKTPELDEGAKKALALSADVLCWVLDHHEVTNFGQNLATAQEWAQLSQVRIKPGAEPWRN